MPMPGRLPIVFALFMALPLAAAETPGRCDSFPFVPWWGNLTQAQVIDFVKTSHAGNWPPYLDKWENQLEIVQGAYDAGSAVLIESTGITLKNGALGAYVEKVGRRVAINQCLADEAG